MAAHKNPGTNLPLYFAFQAALEVGEFELSGLDVIQAFQAPLQGGRYERDATPGMFADIVQTNLRESGLVEPCEGGRYRVTQHAREWGTVFRLGPDSESLFFGRTVEHRTWLVLREAIQAFWGGLKDLSAELHRRLGSHSRPERLTQLMAAASQLHEVPTFPTHAIEADMYRQVVVLACRGQILGLRKREEELEILARDRYVLEGTKRKIECLESILELPEFAPFRAVPKPRVTDFVNVGVIEALKTGRDKDEKFGILSAPTLFSDDFVEISEGVFSRGRSFAVGFIDIDHFKKFNSKHGETVVDQVVLPQFMRALEGYCYGRAYAYRQGGDEYLVLLHNADKDESRVFFEGLQAYIAEIDYPGVLEKKPTVSIGVHVIDGNHEVTVFEGKKLANEAKNKAKAAGRNCVRLSTDPGPEPLPVFWRRQQHLRNHRFRRPLRRPK